MIDRLIWDKIRPLNELEKTFKDAYELVGKYDNRRILNYIPAQMGINVRDYWLPLFNNEQDSYLTQHLTTEMAGFNEMPVAVCPHPRYQQYSLHSHDFYELMYVVKGSCDHVVEEHRFTLLEGEFCLVPPYVRHMVGVFCDESYVYNFLFTKEFEKKAFSLLPEKDQHSGQYDCIRFNIEDGDYVHFLSEKLIKQRYESDDNQLVEANVLSLILYLFLKHSDSSHYYLGKYIQNPRVFEFIFYMQTNYKNVSLDCLSNQFHYTPSYIGSLIKENTGITFTALRSRIRIVQSCYYLINSTDTINEVAEKVGYSNGSYFSKMFKDQIGVIPSVFRKSNSSG